MQDSIRKRNSREHAAARLTGSRSFDRGVVGGNDRIPTYRRPQGRTNNSYCRTTTSRTRKPRDSLGSSRPHCTVRQCASRPDGASLRFSATVCGCATRTILRHHARLPTTLTKLFARKRMSFSLFPRKFLAYLLAFFNDFPFICPSTDFFFIAI